MSISHILEGEGSGKYEQNSSRLILSFRKKKGTSTTCEKRLFKRPKMLNSSNEKKENHIKIERYINIKSSNNSSHPELNELGLGSFGQ